MGTIAARPQLRSFASKPDKYTRHCFALKSESFIWKRSVCCVSHGDGVHVPAPATRNHVPHPNAWRDRDQNACVSALISAALVTASSINPEHSRNGRSKVSTILANNRASDNVRHPASYEQKAWLSY